MRVLSLTFEMLSDSKNRITDMKISDTQKVIKYVRHEGYMTVTPVLSRLRQEDYPECEACTSRPSSQNKQELEKERDRQTDRQCILIMHELKTKL